MDIELSPDQRIVFDAANAWIKATAQSAGAPPAPLTIGGYAGTGKSTVLGCIAKQWQHRRVAYSCFTGRATGVLRKSLDKWAVPYQTNLKGGLLGAYSGTVHSLIYKPCPCRETKSTGALAEPCMCKGYGFIKNASRPPVDLIVIDEASMVHEEMARDLESFGIPIIYVGDHGQLPPVGGKASKMANPTLRLEKIHRQATGNSIVRLADSVRRTGEIDTSLADGVRVLFDKRSNWKAHAVDMAQYACSGMRSTLVCGAQLEGTSGYAIIVRTNAMRLLMNSFVRKNYYGPDFSPEPAVGDYVIALKNKSPVFNGMRGIVEQVLSRGPITTMLSVRFDDLPNAITIWSCNLQFNREKTFQSAHEMEDAYRARLAGSMPSRPYCGEPMDYGYAMTCHKAQGSQFDTVVVYPDGRIDRDDEDYRRWLYTAITRARTKLTILL